MFKCVHTFNHTIPFLLCLFIVHIVYLSMYNKLPRIDCIYNQIVWQTTIIFSQDNAVNFSFSVELSLNV